MRDLRLLLFSALLLLLTVTVVAEPPNGNDDDDGNTPRHGCLGDHEADLILKRFISFFIKPDPVVINKTLTVNFQLFSDSTNFFLGLNVCLPVCLRILFPYTSFRYCLALCPVVLLSIFCR